ncbi:hypothetical protein I7I53_03585 [Histoplasma capsulatum var. duboisii H88]|uniref:Uncharacterized protein n=1 Tax=Ajellomyces capsulatus (strain H88) TaxID=544711 RepID=A0A8A1LRA5_AJEC8|nr:hypothetical protein I7I53_03585 [Histoplasma capsulatum var. duboisii H88]
MAKEEAAKADRDATLKLFPTCRLSRTQTTPQQSNRFTSRLGAKESQVIALCRQHNTKYAHSATSPTTCPPPQRQPPTSAGLETPQSNLPIQPQLQPAGARTYL